MKPLLSSSYTVRFSDCDPFGHLNNSRYVDYFLNAREDHLRTSHDLTLDTYHRQGLGWVVANHEIAYLKPARYNEEVIIRSELRKIGESDILVEMVMLDKNEQHLKAILWTRFVFINLKTGKKDTHPQELLDYFRPMEAGDHTPETTLRSRIAALTPANV